MSTLTNLFESKVAQYKEMMFDGEKDGETWQRKTRNYLCGRLPILKSLLEWAEAFGKTVITQEDVLSLRSVLDDDPGLISHSLWAFLNLNLFGAAMDIFCNVKQFEGLEAWRRLLRG